MNAKATGSYRNKKGTLVFRYAVIGTPAEIEAYKAAQGENYRESDDKTPLFFTTRNAGPSCNLIITQGGKVVADMSKFDAAASLAAQYGGNLGTELAKQAAASLLGGSPASVTTPVQENADLGK